MRKMAARWSLILALMVGVCLVAPGAPAMAADPIVLGCPLSTAFLYGWDAERGIRLAAEEINAKGGVKVGDKMRPLAVEVIDTRDLEPGVPVSEALLGVEKLLLEKKADFIVGGPVRSEAALAAMPIVAKAQKISILTSGSLTPKYSEMVGQQPDKFKYLYRISGEAKWMVTGEIIPCLEEIGKKYNLDRLAIMVQDVAHARAGGNLIAKIMAQKGWTVLGEPEVYPTGATDFSMGQIGRAHV